MQRRHLGTCALSPTRTSRSASSFALGCRFERDSLPEHRSFSIEKSLFERRSFSRESSPEKLYSPLDHVRVLVDSIFTVRFALLSERSRETRQ